MSITTSSLSTCSLLINTSPCFKFHHKFFFNPICDLSVLNHKAHHGRFSPANPSFSYLRNIGLTAQSSNHRSKMDFVVYSSDQAGDLIPLGTLLDSWKNWIPGLLITIILPFFANKWGPFAKFKEEVDMVEETVVKIADKVEEVAERVEKVVEEIADDLPEGGKLKNALTFVDNVAKEAAKDAQFAEDIINKVEEVEKDVESLVDSIAHSDKSKAAPKVE